MTMIRPGAATTVTIVALALAACGSERPADGDAAESSANAGDRPAPLEPMHDEEYNLTSKPEGPVRFNYRVIGTPTVGQPVTIDLVVESNVGDAPIKLNYESNDTTAMSFPETQLKQVAIAFVDDERRATQQVTVVPAREGRLFLNVSATLELESGSMQTAKAIPIQVGAARDLTPSVPATTDEDGNQLREMPAD